MRRRITRTEDLDRPKVRRVVAILVIGTIVSGVAAWLAAEDFGDERQRARPAIERPSDPLRAELDRCNVIGSAALDDATCRRVWAESRRRFFGGAR